MNSLPSLEEEYPEESRAAGRLKAAMNAGLRGDRLPNFGNDLTGEQLLVINAIYDEARNKHAGVLARSRGR